MPKRRSSHSKKRKNLSRGTFTTEIASETAAAKARSRSSQGTGGFERPFIDNCMPQVAPRCIEDFQFFLGRVPYRYDIKQLAGMHDLSGGAALVVISGEHISNSIPSAQVRRATIVPPKQSP